MSAIYILSQPIQSGKTTLLQQWINHQQSVSGILTPDVNGKRMVYDIASNTYYPLQLNEQDEGISIGRFVFDPNGFDKAQAILMKASTENPEWIVVDEIGRLEMDRKEGLEPAVSQLIERFKTYSGNTKLLLVIRDYLLEDVKKHYGIDDAIILSKDFFQANQPIHQSTNHLVTGLVLCGGQSVRMGRDKAFITYHQLPQYAHVAQLMKSFCEQVYLSINEQQKTKLADNYKYIIDNATFVNAGPMTGVLSAFQSISNSALLVTGCDYPYFTDTDMKALLDAREESIDVVCYHHSESGFDEPLLAVYEKQCASLLLHFFEQGHHSLQQFLKTVRVKRIVPNNLSHLKSVDV